MADWEKLRELSHDVVPPDFGSMVHTARSRQRRSRAVAGVLAALVVVGGGFGIAALDRGESTDRPLQPVAPSSDLPDDVRALPAADPGTGAAALDAGRYRIPLDDALALDIDVADETSSHEDGLFLSTGRIVIKAEVAGSDYGVPRDPCTRQAIRPVGPTVDDLVSAMTDLPPYEVSRPEPVRLGGASGTYLEARIPRSYDASACDHQQVHLPGASDTAVGAAPPYVGRWWVLDVGGQRVVIQQNCWGCRFDQLLEAPSDPRTITFTTNP